jgi:RimJ/RimL family protein N-acetyltransferase
VPALRLVPFDASHLHGLQGLLDDPLVLRFTRVPEPVPPGFAATWLGAYETGRRDGTREGFALIGADEDFLGVGVVPRIEAASATAEIGYVVAEHARGRGVAQEALAQLTEWAFAELGSERLELLISVENGASKRVAERCGYRREGVLRSVYIKPGRREDTEIWSRLVSDA